jgi:hypothetical protein
MDLFGERTSAPLSQARLGRERASSGKGIDGRLELSSEPRLLRQWQRRGRGKESTREEPRSRRK